MTVRTYSLAMTANVATEVTVATAITILALSSSFGFDIASITRDSHRGKVYGVNRTLKTWRIAKAPLE
jgi:hypothetical protein